MLEENPELQLEKDQGSTRVENTQAEEDIRPTPCYFKMATIKNVDKAEKVIYLNVQSECSPTCQCGDGCATNMKAARLVDEIVGVKSPFTRCGSHAASGSLKRLCTSQTMCNDDAKALYENLRALLKHFSMSNKSTDLLNKALDTLEMNNIHILNWGSTRMAGFLNACIQSSKIIIPFLDTIITMKIPS